MRRQNLTARNFSPVLKGHFNEGLLGYHYQGGDRPMWPVHFLMILPQKSNGVHL